MKFYKIKNTNKCYYDSKKSILDENVRIRRQRSTDVRKLEGRKHGIEFIRRGDLTCCNKVWLQRLEGLDHTKRAPALLINSFVKHEKWIQ